MSNSTTTALEADLEKVVGLMKDYDLRGAHDCLIAVADAHRLSIGTTYVAVDAGGNAIARVALRNADADRQLAELSLMGYRTVKTVR
tara:strand:- start:42 stop:302 length:261 start_codon:yes stop_codon:yes gene_type:complete